MKDTPHASIAVPLHVNTAYAFRDSRSARDIFELKLGGFLYTRLNNPTTQVLEDRIAAFEGGIGAVATSCGQSANALAFLTLLKSGDHIVASKTIYGGTFNLLSVTLPRLGIHTTFADFSDLEALRTAITPSTKLVFCETLGNPKLDFTDIKSVSAIAHEHGLPLFVDNTLTSGLYHPIEDGADAIIYSLTKYVCGNGTAMGGAIIDSGKYDWGKGLFPEFVEPNESYHGIRFSEAFGPAAFLVRLKVEGLRDLGSCISPQNSFAILQGLETLHVRMKATSETTLKLAEWLKTHPLVEWVNYPGLEEHPQHTRCKEVLKDGFGAILTFAPKGGYEVAKKVAESTRLLRLVANLGDSKSLIIHPSSTTHNQLSPQDQLDAGVTPDLIRLSIGLEGFDDIREDIEYALQAAQS